MIHPCIEEMMSGFLFCLSMSNHKYVMTGRFGYKFDFFYHFVYILVPFRFTRHLLFYTHVCSRCESTDRTEVQYFVIFYIMSMVQEIKLVSFKQQ